MRVSIEREDPGYAEFAKHKCFRVFVDGEEISAFCITADEEKGEAHCFAVNEAGEKYTDPNTGVAARCVLYGQVQIMPVINGVHRNAQSG